MSRCFPFPPPGYEKKARPDDENLLEKEKRKEKKHKKEKKDRNKKDKKDKKDKEGKQKKGKEISEEKRRERKDRKERHKHKKDKNKEKEKEKKRPSEDNITAGLLECSTVDNPGSGCTQSDETSDMKFLVGLGKRIRNDDKTTENLVVKKINHSGKICSEYPEKVGVGNNGNSDGNAMRTEKRIYDRILCERSNNSDRKFCERSNSDVRGTETGNVQNFVVGQQKKVEGVAGLVGKIVEKTLVHNKVDEHNGSESRGDRSNGRDRDGKKKLSTERKSEKEPNKEQQPLARERSRHAVCNDNNTESSPLPNESNKNSNLGKRKELRINGFLHDDEIRPFKLQRPLSCTKEVVENAKDLKTSKTLTKSILSSRSTSENGGRLETLKASSLVASDSGRSSIVQKVDDKVMVAHPVLENRAFQKAVTLTAAGGHEATDHSKVDNKEHKINGIVKDKRRNGSSTRPSSSTAKQIVGEYPKPPHRDSKYLSKILAIPSIEGPGFDEQEWLLGSNSKSTEANPRSSQFKETKQVWDKALQLESADITALPYVIPY